MRRAPHARLAKATGIAIILVGHVTWRALAGPRVLEHMVDTVLYFEGDTHSSFRLVRAIKNRFGAVNEIGVFAMTERGLKGVANPSAIFLPARRAGARQLRAGHAGGHAPRCWWRYRPWWMAAGPARGACRSAWARPPGHAAGGFAPPRGRGLRDQDVFVNAVGGVRISEPAADLAVMLAISSSLRGRACQSGFIAFGEVGPGRRGAPAARPGAVERGAKLGFTVAVVPKANAPKAHPGLQIHPWSVWTRPWMRCAGWG